MLKIINVNICALWLCVLLCGCTRREQLVLEDISTEQEQLADFQAAQGHSESETPDVQERDSAEAQVSQGQSAAVNNGEPQTIFVHVCGAVVSPDVYELPAGSRVYEAVQAAGGFTEDADSNYVNQAQILSDGVKLVIPTMEQTSAKESEDTENNGIGIVGESGSVGGQGVTDTGTSSYGKININTASEAELCNIPGIGAVRAAAIVAYRQEKGGFSTIEDIMNVSGIKEGTYEKIKDSIKVN